MNNPSETNPSPIRIILTGATGMVGEGVLQECLNSPDISEVLIINRRNADVQHPKLTEIVYPDLYDLSNIDEKKITGYDACFFCMGVTSIGKSEGRYYRSTYTLTLNFAETLLQQNTNMTFCYISGAGTDSTEKGRVMWARVKGKTENALMKLPFKKVYNFRPGALQASKGQKNILPYYTYFAWLIPLIRLIAPSYISTLQDLGRAMIYASTREYEKQIIEVKDINALGKKL